MSFFGGGTDMEDFFRVHGGAVLSTTFDKYCYVNVRHLPPFLITGQNFPIQKQKG
jgi:D-glycero-alpha-D-manno-heptose-7-phosphate kinase